MSMVEQIKEGQSIYIKLLKGDKCNAEDTSLLKNLQEEGYHSINNPFFKASFGVNNHIYNTPTDVMHLFLCGLIKSVLLWTLTIINEINTHLTIDKSVPLINNTGFFEQRLKEIVTVPEVPYLKWYTFKSDGLIYLAKTKCTLEKSDATGSGGGFRSSEYVVALMQTYFAVSPKYNYLFIHIIRIIFDRGNEGCTAKSSIISI